MQHQPCSASRPREEGGSRPGEDRPPSTGRGGREPGKSRSNPPPLMHALLFVCAHAPVGIPPCGTRRDDSKRGDGVQQGSPVETPAYPCVAGADGDPPWATAIARPQYKQREWNRPPLSSCPSHHHTSPDDVGWDPLPTPHPVHPAHSPTDPAPCPPLCAFPTPLALLPSTDAAAMARSSTARFSGAALCIAMVAVMLVLLVPASCDAAAGPPRRGGPIVAEAPARPGADGGGEVATTDRSAPANESSGCCSWYCCKKIANNHWCITVEPVSSRRKRCFHDSHCSSQWDCLRRSL